jgi:hypothetical protein
MNIKTPFLGEIHHFQKHPMIFFPSLESGPCEPRRLVNLIFSPENHTFTSPPTMTGGHFTSQKNGAYVINPSLGWFPR